MVGWGIHCCYNLCVEQLLSVYKAVRFVCRVHYRRPGLQTAESRSDCGRLQPTTMSHGCAMKCLNKIMTLWNTSCPWAIRNGYDCSCTDTTSTWVSLAVLCLGFSSFGLLPPSKDLFVQECCSQVLAKNTRAETVFTWLDNLATCLDVTREQFIVTTLFLCPTGIICLSDRFSAQTRKTSRTESAFGYNEQRHWALESDSGIKRLCIHVSWARTGNKMISLFHGDRWNQILQHVTWWHDMVIKLV